jgi:exodeoxyribonuclease V alpha subunit
MVGTPDLWLILDATPVAVDLLLVGDQGQLPPIRAGNPAAAVAASRSIPKVNLRLPHRQAGSTGIPWIAGRMREGELPRLPEFDPANALKPGVFMLACQPDQVQRRVLGVFRALAGEPPARPSQSAVDRLHRADVQILAMTRNGPAGASDIGDAVERQWMAEQPMIHNWGMHVGSKILWTRNSYDRKTGRQDVNGDDEIADIMNGTLGIIGRSTDVGAEARFDDGTRAEIRRPDLGQLLRGWAITVHKAQGSGFRSVIIPIVRSRLLDRALLYTAVTRAKVNAIFVGDPDLVERATGAPPNVWRRLQALDFDATQGMRH